MLKKLSIFALCSVLFACGQKGALYLPTPEQAPNKAPNNTSVTPNSGAAPTTAVPR